MSRVSQRPVLPRWSAEDLTATLKQALPLLEGKVENVYDELPHTFWWKFREGRLYFSLIPAFPFLSVPSSCEALWHPPVPTPFTQTLRHHLRGQRLLQWSQPQGERMVTFVFDRVHLVAELIPQRSNLLLLRPDQTILALLFPREEKDRRLLPGELYIPPKPRQRSEQVTSSTSWEELRQGLIQLWTCQYRQSRTQRLRKRKKQVEKTLQKLEREREQVEGADQYLYWGELLKSHYHLLRKGLSEVTLVDYGTTPPQELSLPLDPRKSPKENLEAYFQKYKKAKRARQKLEERRGQLERELAELEAALREWETLPEEELLERYRQEYSRQLSEAFQKGKKVRQEEKRKPYRQFISKDGWEIFVGKGARENDQLTLRFARGRDYFFHVDGASGAHVVVRTPHKQAPLPQETLLDAATLALYFSQRRKGEEGDVAYTRCSQVRKAKGAPPGKVQILSPKIIHLRLEKDRLQRLLEERK